MMLDSAAWHRIATLQPGPIERARQPRAVIGKLDRPSQRSMSRLLTFLFLCSVSSCRDPRAEANIAQAMTEVGTTLTLVQQDYALLQSQVDSLRTVVARQDTIISRLASLAGLPIPPR